MTNPAVSQRLYASPALTRWAAALVSVLWSIIVSWQHPMLNDDAYGYLHAAALLQSDGALAVFEQYGWYCYSIVIALLDPLLPGDLLLSAQIFNAVTMALLVIAFIECSYALQPAPQTRVLAALTVLLFPLLNEMRFFLIRDFAFWAFALLSLWQLLRFCQQPQWRSACYWCVFLLLATVFRLEALLLALLTPLWLWRTHGTRTVGMLYAVLAMAALGLLALSLLTQFDVLALMQFAYRYYLPSLFDLPNVLAQNALKLNASLFSVENFPGSSNTSHGVVLLVLSYIYTLAAQLVAALGVPLTMLLTYATWRGWLCDAQQPSAWRAYSSISALSLLAFLSIMHFLTQRYATLVSLLLLLCLPSALMLLYRTVKISQHFAWCRAGAVVLVFVYLIDSLFSFGHSQAHIQEANAWINANLPPAQSVTTNDHYLAYSSKRVVDYDKIKVSAKDTIDTAQAGQTLVISLKARDQESRQLLEKNAHFELLQSFATKHGDEVMVYRVQ
jgi:hypothetical protein